MKRLSRTRIILGTVFIAMFILLCILQKTGITTLGEKAVNVIAAIDFAACCICLLPQKSEEEIKKIHPQKLSKRTIISSLFILIAVPVTLFLGVYCMSSERFYLVITLVLLEVFVPFFMNFESKRPGAREIVVISVLCAIAVAGRVAFIMLSSFKPIAAIVIIAGVCLGAETGFLVGAVSALVSNFFFGQGMWTPWQMFAFGLIGFLAGVLYKKGILKSSRLSLAVFGFLSIIIIYGGIINGASLILWQPHPTKELIISSYAGGFQYDLIHAAATAFFLWFISAPMIEKLERVKTKYGFDEI